MYCSFDCNQRFCVQTFHEFHNTPINELSTERDRRTNEQAYNLAFALLLLLLLLLLYLFVIQVSKSNTNRPIV